MYNALTHANAATIGRVLALASIPLWVWVCGLLLRRISQPRPLPAHAIDSSTYQVPPTHVVHVVDFDRSQVTICEDQTILARCCMQGCDVTVKIGRDIIGLVVSAELKEKAE